MRNPESHAGERSRPARAGIVAIAALAVALAAASAGWAGGLCPADLNDDGVVNVDDLLMLLADWGECAVAPPLVCCTAHGGLGCVDDPPCEACVCAQDPFCCELMWDGICATRATGVCADSCACAGDPEPCIGDIDGNGVVNADDLTMLLADWGECPSPPPACGPGAGDCCVFNGTPGCEDGRCCEIVCGLEPSCCEDQWGSTCRALASEHCDICGCGAADAGSCCEPNGNPGCENEECCEAVCACDPFCCDVQWDIFCVTSGFDPDCLCGPGGCGVVNTPECAFCFNGPCDCDVSGGIGCPENAVCEKCVCGQDGFCCDIAWDGICADRAVTVCADACCNGDPPPVCGPGAGDCCSGNNSPGCDNLECCEAVCACDPFCCDVQWDIFCVTSGFDADCLCGVGQCGVVNTPECAFCFEDPPPPACGPGAGDCFAPGGNGTPGCDDADCCAAVCADDPFCCEVAWDGLCSDAAWKAPACFGGDPVCAEVAGAGDPCCAEHAGIGCTDFRCCEAVCDADVFCCDVQWDAMCADAAGTHAVCHCPPPPPPACMDNDADCCSGHAGAGCGDQACCEIVCACDPFCCEVQWDQFCADNPWFLVNDCFPPPGCPAPFPEACGGAAALCPRLCEEVPICGAAGDCCEPHGGLGCDDEACCECVCGQDGFCCDIAWDGICAGRATGVCQCECACAPPC